MKHLKICLKHQIYYYHSLNNWLLGATIGNHVHSVMNCQWSQATTTMNKTPQNMPETSISPLSPTC